MQTEREKITEKTMVTMSIFPQYKDGMDVEINTQWIPLKEALALVRRLKYSHWQIWTVENIARDITAGGSTLTVLAVQHIVLAQSRFFSKEQQDSIFPF